MSAPTSGSAGGSPTPGFYPDPSIPGYIRYWNGAAWVPGTSRPAPAEGEAMPAPPPGAAPPTTPAVEETGPVFLDEDEPAAGDAGLPVVRRSGEVEARPAAAGWDDPARLHGTSPEPASAWQADASRQSGFGNETDRRISWGAPDQAPAGTPSGAASWGSVPPQRDEQPAADPASGDVPGTPSSATPAPGAPSDGTVAIRAVNPAARRGKSGDQGTTAIRAVRPGAAAPAKGNETMAIRVAGGGRNASPTPGGAPQSLPSVGAPAQQTPAQQTPAQQSPAPQHPAPQQAQPAPGGQQPPAGFPAQHAAAPTPSTPPAAAPPASGPAQGAGAEGVIPWKPPSAADPFFAAAQAAQGHPAGLGRRLAARLIDTLVLGAVTAAVAVPMWGTVTDHIDAKVEAARQSGRQVTVYLIDGTTAPVFATILAVLLIGGALYEALPVLKWGRTLGKKLCGVRVLDIESHDSPMLAAALKRWFCYSLLGVLAIGVVNVVWCVFDRPWRQCWHDKLARTFVAAD
ncbi:RDD family protein [Streptomyces endophytica]|uniref:RDD family protein n=1 Tax=Streptomyces endophytica TaxID=2991496 RepID=A0ABY6PBN7_9ACTN|nr:RDD family protein [Streptomyces endophytica]UZJ31191.1 RDD family protein [Streptomyces endophytica]